MRRISMKRFGSLFIIGVVMLSLSCFLTSCGGGSDASTSREGGPDASLTASNAQQVGETVLQAVKLVAPTATLGDLKISSIYSEKRPPLVSILEKVMSVSGNSITAKHISSLNSINESCANGGNIEVNITSIDPLDQVINADINVNSCMTGTQTLNGTMKVEYVVESIDALTDPSLDNLKNFKKATITTSGLTYVNTENNDNVTLTNLTVVLKDFTYNGNILKGGSITLGGTVTGIIAGETINVECDSFGLRFTTDSTTGVTVSVSGRIKASCLNGWVRMATNSQVYYPVNAHCPIGGDIVVSSGENNVRVIIAADSRITIYFNEDLVQTFNSCDDVKGLCTG
jgi:hypothetical protein